MLYRKIEKLIRAFRVGFKTILLMDLYTCCERNSTTLKITVKCSCTIRRLLTHILTHFSHETVWTTDILSDFLY